MGGHSKSVASRALGGNEDNARASERVRIEFLQNAEDRVKFASGNRMTAKRMGLHSIESN